MTRSGHFRLVLGRPFPHNFCAVGLPRVTTTNLYSEHAETIEAVLSYVRRAHRLSADDGDEFASWARLRLLEDDCAILRKFRGLSTFKTFVVTVIQRLFLDWRIKEWGKWRPTADARRLGPVAIELERLILRDGVDFEQAVETLVSKGTALTRNECERVWRELPRRAGRQRAGEATLESVPAPRSDDSIELDEQSANADRARRALSAALPALAPQEQLIIRLRFQDGITVARIAQLLGEEQKPLYRRIEQILTKLRASLTTAGVTAEAVRDLLGNPVVELGTIFPADETGKVEIGPSTSPNAGGGA
jgi:RNA polymerase sigma factor for flagellar operon FliA